MSLLTLLMGPPHRLSEQGASLHLKTIRQHVTTMDQTLQGSTGSVNGKDKNRCSKEFFFVSKANI